jgi:WhiB family transcriptional regulator, redox-sensing transcriptional regulator
VPEQQAWERQAACRREGAELWFDLSRREEAQAVCGSCPVADACLDHAIDNGIWFGVWGGMVPSQRRRVARQRAARPDAAGPVSRSA